MTVEAEDIAAIFSAALEHLKDGAFGVLIRNLPDGVLIERVDPVLSVAQVAEFLNLSEDTIRQMEDRGQLHAAKTKGRSGVLRFRKSRLVADLATLERL